MVYSTHFNTRRNATSMPDITDMYMAAAMGRPPNMITQEAYLPQYRTLTVKRATNFNDMPKALTLSILEQLLDRAKHTQGSWHEFKIAKRSGGKMRTIQAPSEDLKILQRELVHIMRDRMGILEHNAAYGYVPGVDRREALYVHKANGSRWFLKIDLQNFFPSCTYEVVRSELAKLARISANGIIMDKIMSIIYRIGTYNNALPQGSCCSPYLSNLVMLPRDYEITTALNKAPGYFAYTRYADDIVVSSKYKFDHAEIIKLLTELLDPFIINPEKTMFRSNAGSNWMLGLMYNKNKEITSGHRNTRSCKTKLHNLLLHYNEWDHIDYAEFRGQLADYRQTRPDYIDYTIERLEKKTGTTLAQVHRHFHPRSE